MASVRLHASCRCSTWNTVSVIIYAKPGRCTGNAGLLKPTYRRKSRSSASVGATWAWAGLEGAVHMPGRDANVNHCSTWNIGRSSPRSAGGNWPRVPFPGRRAVGPRAACLTCIGCRPARGVFHVEHRAERTLLPPQAVAQERKSLPYNRSWRALRLLTGGSCTRSQPHVLVLSVVGRIVTFTFPLRRPPLRLPEGTGQRTVPRGTTRTVIVPQHGQSIVPRGTLTGASTATRLRR